MVGPSGDVPQGTPPVLRIETAVAAGVGYVTLTGELDLSGEEAMAAVVDGLLSDGSLRELVIDLAGVIFCDSSGIRILVKAHHAAQAAEGSISARRALDGGG